MTSPPRRRPVPPPRRVVYVPERPPRKVARGEWVRLIAVMALLAGFIAVIVFAVGDKSGDPTQRTPMPGISADAP